MAESAIRSGRKHGFTVIQNPILLDPSISLKTKGLYAAMASLPENWEYSISGLAVKFGVGKDAIRSGLKELEAHGYLVREKQCREQGRFSGGVVFILYDEPQCSPSSGFPTTDKPSTEKPSSENPTQQKKDLQKKDKETPKAPKSGRRAGASKYALQEDAKPLLRRYVGEDNELAHALADLIELRQDLNAINSAKAIGRLLDKLDSLSGGTRSVKLALISQSIENSWKSIFPLRGAGQAVAGASPPCRVTEEEGTYLL